MERKEFEMKENTVQKRTCCMPDEREKDLK